MTSPRPSLSPILAGLLLALALHLPATARADQPTDPPAPADQPEPPITQVLIIPLGGTLPAPWSDTPAELSQVLERVVTMIGAEPVPAAVGKSDITAITGCPAESDDCFREVASTIEVDQILFGTVEPSADGSSVEVALTLIRRDGSLSRRRISVAGNDPGAAAASFEPQSRAFLLGEEPPTEPQPNLTVPETEAPPPAPGFSFSRVKPYSWAIAGGGVALVGIGAYLLVKAGDKQDEVDQARVDTIADFDRLVDLENSGKRLTTWGNVLVIGGSLAAVAGVALAVKQGLEQPAASPTPPAAPSTEVTVAPLAGPQGGLAVTVLGRF